ncbi:hypothetical protein M3699_27220 [Peribacillus simplex]|uniref:hypothetical protein n=1 Tax=Peribacillus simplex TaxID=1478 RepID=UPI00203F7E79|nr:hypothetical protein [Peribacillus simplex]MCM3677373.1 hypothetical protein [Peribacillus simplex]
MTVRLETLLDRSEKNMGSGIHPVVKESALEMVKRAYQEHFCPNQRRLSVYGRASKVIWSRSPRLYLRW